MLALFCQQPIKPYYIKRFVANDKDLFMDQFFIFKQLLMYVNDAIEATFVDGCKIYLSPCGTEYVFQNGNQANGLLNEKHRTIYTTSSLIDRIKPIIEFRNLFAEIPFLVAAFVDKSQCYHTTADPTHVRWSYSNLPIDNRTNYTWTSICGRAEILLPKCKQIVYVKHPIQVSRIPYKDDKDEPTSKYINVFAPVQRLFKVDQCPIYLKSFITSFLEFIEQLEEAEEHHSVKRTLFDSDNDDKLCFELPKPLSTNCQRANQHRLYDMMFESDIKILKTKQMTYRMCYDEPQSIEAIANGTSDYVVTTNIQTVFYNYYCMKANICQLLTISECSLPPQNEQLEHIISFMSTMRQRMLTMSKYVKETPCWEEQTMNDKEMCISNKPIYKQIVVPKVGHFLYYEDNSVQIQYCSNHIVDIAADQVQLCQLNHFDFRCRLTINNKTIEIYNASNSGIYLKYISGAIEWCLWILEQKRFDRQRNLMSSIEQELFVLKHYSTMNELRDTNSSLNSSSLLPPVSTTINDQYSTPMYTQKYVNDILQQTTRFTQEIEMSLLNNKS
ncbi:unnamed protein product [Didymodactylos carnosus]|uniref:C5orf34-like N-terminal domain-containing protein n=1 Tax=Didymodactylos carnosus TaxID=1234261 RepID=A0A814DK61_9BILA|nr:unnamed protein product [Didymodactylos carnosus]CAF0955571.1 unnamed protein product [Didymodactylos carnosus]CAF3622557.1 unnamed protein product [Didymodactylos carnosus]CAF3730644.1 unnamed protein product [Didymodactylos carnosus]